MSAATDPDARSGGRDSVALGLFAVSASLLTLEILATRLFSYSLPPILVYCAVGVAFLGIGASGTLLSVWRGWRRVPLAVLGAWTCAGFAASTVLSTALFARVSEELCEFVPGPRHFAYLAALASPYLFAGAAVAASLSAAREGVHRAYRVNLLGSALGCFTVFWLLAPLGAPRLVALLGLAGTAAGALYLGRAPGRAARAALAVAGGLSAAAAVAPDAWFPFRPEPSGQLRLIDEGFRAHGWDGEAVLEWSAWDPTGRIEVHSFPGIDMQLPDPVPGYFYSQDGSAGSVLFGVGDDLSRMRALFDETLYGAAYHMRGDTRGEDVLVIGLGGGPDVQAAHWFESGSVTGVDINRSAIEAVGERFADFTGDPYGRPGVDVVHMDGRTFARSTERRFDLIQMSGVDTKSIHSAGSLAISENTLYTVEALEEYLSRLKPGGMLSILRFGNVDRLRLAGIAIEALRRRGAEHPERHFVALEQNAWGTVLVGAEPLERADVERLEAWVAGIPAPTRVQIPMYDVLVRFRLSDAPRMLYSPFRAPEEQFEDVGSLFAATARGEERAYLDSVRLNVAPTTDDRPFFFDRQKRAELLDEPQPHYRIMGAFLLFLTLLAGLFILAPLPLFLARRDEERVGVPSSILYFLALGLGFMLLEIGMVQKFVLFLGHQSYSLTVVFASLLLGAGTGSAWAGRRARTDGADARLVRRLAVPAIVGVSLVVLALIDFASAQAATLPLGARIALVAAMMLPLGFFLGIPFPTGLAHLERHAPLRVPWAVGANGFASVIASSAAMPGAMLFGYRALFAAGLLLYLVAALSYPRARAGRRA